jgi:hypothetical protein
MIEIINDPIKTVVQATENIFGQLDCEIQFAPVKLEAGCFGNVILEDGVKPLINIDPSIPYGAVLEVLAHELAHVVCPQDNDHGEDWEKAFNDIFDEYNKMMESKASEGGNWMYVNDDGEFVECKDKNAKWNVV